jgi:hypothetical protein
MEVLPAADMAQLVRTCSFLRQLIWPALSRRRWWFVRDRLQRLLYWEDRNFTIHHNIHYCVVHDCPHIQAIKIDLTVDHHHLLVKRGQYCWRHRPSHWP